LNYAACGPVMLAVGLFSLYHFYCASNNTTTIEGWEKDKVATLVRRGKIRDLEFPYNLGAMENLRAVFGPHILFWCWPQTMRGSGTSYRVAEGTDSDIQYSWPPKDPNKYEDEDRSGNDITARLSGSPWTYGSSVNPALNPSNATTPYSRGAPTSAVPPYHPSYRQNEFPAPAIRDDHSTTSSPSRESFSSNEGYEADASRDNWADTPGPVSPAARAVRVRRGSEGWEVRPLSKEEIVRRYEATRGIAASASEPAPQFPAEGPGLPFLEENRYKRYVPDTSTPDSSEEDPLQTHVGAYDDELNVGFSEADDDA